jgi:hypothetical protein
MAKLEIGIDVNELIPAIEQLKGIRITNQHSLSIWNVCSAKCRKCGEECGRINGPRHAGVGHICSEHGEWMPSARLVKPPRL